jgi:hypothetical protein
MHRLHACIGCMHQLHCLNLMHHRPQIAQPDLADCPPHHRITAIVTPYAPPQNPPAMTKTPPTRLGQLPPTMTDIQHLPTTTHHHPHTHTHLPNPSHTHR